jgi:pimeloyl-ACP methyl ester carboxylesterase
MRLLLDGFTHHTVNTGEVEIGYSVGPGNGPAMLLLHGMSSRRDGFMHVTGILSEKHKVFMMDQRGHGYSGHASGQYGREDHVRDVVFVLENVINQPAII